MITLKNAAFDLSKNLPESMKAREDVEEMRGSVVGLVCNVGHVGHDEMLNGEHINVENVKSHNIEGILTC